MIYIVRHGQTEKNRAKLLQGRSDLPLDEVGKFQAEELGTWFRNAGITFDAVWSSPLLRAVQTAELAAGKEVPVRTDPRLIEMDYGPYEGMDLRNPAPEVMAFFRDFAHTPAPEGMEPLDKIVARLGNFLEEIGPDSDGRNILISTHAIAMKAALEYLTPDADGRWWSTFIGNCAVFETAFEGGAFLVPAAWGP